MKLFRSMTSALASLALLAGVFASSAAMAQVPGVGQPVAPAQFRTYRAVILNLAPAASATDFFTIQGSATAAVLVRSIKCSGVSTANGSALVQVVKRSTLDTTGTSTTMTNVRLNANQPVATAVVKAYTVNPGVLGTAIGTVDAGFLTTNTLATSTVSNGALVFDFTNQNLFIDAATTQVALNANAQSFTAGAALSCTVEWAEF